MVKSSESCHHRGRQKSSTWEVICRVTGHHFEQSVCCSLPLSSPPPARPAPDGLEVTARVSCPKASRQLCPLQVSLLIRESVTGFKSVCVCVCTSRGVCGHVCNRYMSLFNVAYPSTSLRDQVCDIFKTLL